MMTLFRYAKDIVRSIGGLLYEVRLEYSVITALAHF